MKSIHFLILSIAFLFGNLATFSQEALPPVFVDVSPNLTANWLPPAKVLLDEKFEGSGTPAGWQLSSQGQGWSLASSAQIGLITVPPYSQFFIVNDGTAPAGNNGCCDYLITPALDLSQYSGYHFSFLSFYNGNYGQLARLEISTDNGATWNLLLTMNPDPTWRFIYVDLSAYSGPGGYSNVKLAFHADDQGQQASGWVVDDVYLRSGSIAVQEYQVTLNGVVAGNTTETSFQFNPENYDPANEYVCCVSAIYPTIGMSPATCDSFPEFCTPPPQNLADTIIGDSIVFTWSSMSSYFYFDHFNVYVSNVNTIPIQTTDTSTTLFSPPGQLCILITAVYDLTPYGFPGCFSESNISTLCGFMDGGFAPPFNEDWSTGLFSLNQWEAGSNWSIDGQIGNGAPSVLFTSPPGKSAYESTLTSWYMDATNITECSSAAFDLDFDIRLEDPSSSGTEHLEILVSTGDTIYSIAEYSNIGSFNWQMVNKHITQLVQGTTFRIIFKTSGMNTGGLVKWNIDNIHMYAYIVCFGPGIDISLQRMGSPEDDILVSWEINPANTSTTEYVMDDGTAEEQPGLGQAGEMWLGNLFPVSDAGVLQHASVFMTGVAGSTATYSIDIFDASYTLVGSSQSFIPISGNWTNINLPDISFNGTFYAMLHIQTNGISDKIGLDTNGPNASGDYAWYYDGFVWTKTSIFGMPPGVFLIRIKSLVEGDDKINSFSSENDPSGQVINSMKKSKSFLQNEKLQFQTTTLSECDTIGYDIYRRAYSSYPAGSNNGTGVWEWIGCTPRDVPQFLDMNLDNMITNCYEYSIGVIYSTGLTLPCGNAWNCIFVGLPEVEAGQVGTYPNPANQSARFEMGNEYKQASVYNISGKEIERVELEGNDVLILNTSQYSPGAYFVRFVKADGNSISLKLLVQH